jgi:hypothetical protein
VGSNPTPSASDLGISRGDEDEQPDASGNRHEAAAKSDPFDPIEPNETALCARLPSSHASPVTEPDA